MPHFAALDLETTSYLAYGKMNRSQLRNVIESGRAIALDCYSIGKEIPADDPVGKLFETDILNKSVLLKQFEKALATARQPVIISTLVYFPYDFDNVYDGGESLNFSDSNFHNALAFKITKGEAGKEVLDRIGADLKVLELINSMHSLDPFMLRSKAEQQGLEKLIHSAYFAISPAEWDKIRLPIREKISKLVSKALAAMDGSGDPLAREQYVERFLMKIWQAKDIDGIEPFIKAMQIQPEKAPEVFFAWKAVCYYQVRFQEVQHKLKTLFQWAGHNQLCFPVDHIRLSPEEVAQIRAKRDVLRQKMREGYVSAHQVLGEYERSYNLFVDEDKPQKFMGFLESSENSYLSLASHVSIATHSVNLWKWYIEQFGPELRYAQFRELFDGLTSFYGVDKKSMEMA